MAVFALWRFDVHPYTHSNTKPSKKDQWATPPEIFKQIQELVNIPLVLDVCASSNNAKTKCYLSEEDDSLNKDWKSIVSRECQFADTPVIGAYVNPPYSNPWDWCKKAASEAEKGLIVVGLLNDDRSTRWYQEWIEGVASVCFVPTKRISFLNDDGEIIKGNNRGQVIPLWTPWYYGRTEYVRCNLNQ